MTKSAGVTVLQGSKEGRREWRIAVVLYRTECLGSRAARVVGGCIHETRGHISLEKRWMRTYERITQMAGDLWVFSSEMTEDVSDEDVKACCRWRCFQREIEGVLPREVFWQLQNRLTVTSSGKHLKHKSNWKSIWRKVLNTIAVFLWFPVVTVGGRIPGSINSLSILVWPLVCYRVAWTGEFDSWDMFSFIYK